LSLVAEGGCVLVVFELFSFFFDSFRCFLISLFSFRVLFSFSYLIFSFLSYFLFPILLLSFVISPFCSSARLPFAVNPPRQSFSKIVCSLRLVRLRCRRGSNCADVLEANAPKNPPLTVKRAVSNTNHAHDWLDPVRPFLIGVW
jgi:hypothetical protein